MVLAIISVLNPLCVLIFDSYMTLNLQADSQAIRDYIEERIRNYSVGKNGGPGDGKNPIGLITAGYSFEQSGNVHVVFDTRPDADSDGQWTNHLGTKANTLGFPAWLNAFEHLCDEGSVTVTMPNGEERVLDESADSEIVARMFGELLRDVMVSLRNAGAFAKLPLAPEAFFVVEDFDGQYGWPGYEKRKTLGSLSPKTPGTKSKAKK